MTSRVKGIILMFVLVIVIGTLVPALWPTFISTDTVVQGLNGTDTATTTFKAFWPIVLMLIGLAVAVGLIMFAVGKFNSKSGGYATIETILFIPFIFNKFTKKDKHSGKFNSFGGAPSKS